MQSGIDRSLLKFVFLLDIGPINVHGSIFADWIALLAVQFFGYSIRNVKDIKTQGENTQRFFYTSRN